MEDTSKYLIHADVTADGVVERSDVVGAIFGQTEGLLGDELDLRDLRQSQKVGRIDVEIASTGGKSHGHLTIATSLDKVETATLAASLETIDRVGPCRANLEVTELEDVRAAKRKEVVERAKELLETGFDDSVMSSEEILAEVRQHVRVEDITEYEGVPAGPRVTDSDAIIVVEGRSDVLTLLKYGVKNAIAVEGTNVPDAIAELTRHRTVTAFLDGDRGGDLILEELAQVGDIDYVAFAPSGESVEELDHHQLFTALRNKVPYETVSGMNEPREAIAATDGSATPAPSPTRERPDPSSSDRDSDDESSPSTVDVTDDPPSAVDSRPTPSETSADDDAEEADDEHPVEEPETVYGHADEVVRQGTDRVRFLDAENEPIDEADASEAYATLEDLESAPTTMVLDEILGQRLLDLAADRGVERIVARSLGQFTKRPTDVRIHAIDDVAEEAPTTD
ncbi:DNA primase DnaG [Natronobacterium texcoconense]|uniref:DNA primase DnaG n=1 Tax=Natronobacterium texcoconense TaxID=1095778 RepID=A0A1H1FL37_NATTX|nr:DNA primase DnaG [Natronobacterium texcoconense]SDR01651.1 DNA primase [Natronobacterium texcoconense]